MKARKNKRRIDPRWHLDDTIEEIKQESNAVRQERIKKNFHDFSFDSWLVEDKELEEAHCNTAHDRDDDKELEEAHCNTAHNRDDDDAECKPDYRDLDNDKDEKECMSKAAKDAEAQNELQVHHHVGDLGSDKEVKPISPRKVKSMKAVEDAKRKGLEPVRKDPPNLEEEG